MQLIVPEYDITLTPGNTVRIGRFQRETWVVSYGWYSWGGNRPVCGWYLMGTLTKEIKPLYYTDIEDIYIIET